ncbi:hypothetical protein SUGI_0627730 [Cryptomeria japonica]|nr:hypothetical protein SUGI_0627730 [Cryptomeria japonica]
MEGCLPSSLFGGNIQKAILDNESSVDGQEKSYLNALNQEIGIDKKDKQFTNSSPNLERVVETNRQEVLILKAMTGTGSSSRSEDTIKDGLFVEHGTLRGLPLFNTRGSL